MSETKQQCPEFPFFGASYPDACCVNGYLWDLDKCNEHGELYGEGDIPCPFCKTEAFIEHDPLGIVDKFLSEMAVDETMEECERNEPEAIKKTREWYLAWIDKMRERYG